MLLQVSGLEVTYRHDAREVRAVRGVSFDLAAGEVAGIIGESGCGKSSVAAAILGALPPGTRTRGSIRFQGRELAGLSEPSLRALRGAAVALVPQDPSAGLHPMMRAGVQIAEVFRAHRAGGRDAQNAAAAALDSVGLPPAQFFNAYPHQLSGGQKQRVALARAMVCRPALVAADEPASSLDRATRDGIFRLIAELSAGTTFLIVTHDPSSLASLARRIMVMYAGRVIEDGPAARILERAAHPYTAALLACGARRTDGNLSAIPGTPPDPAAADAGCAFAPRCTHRVEDCAASVPPLISLEGHGVRCVAVG